MVISPLLYNADENIVAGSNAKVLRDILDMMVIYPSVNVTFTGHTHNEGSKAYDLYFSAKRAEQAAQYLMANGIDGNRIIIYGVGSNYPMVKRQGSTLATRNNNRIEIDLTDEIEPGLNVSYNFPLITDYLEDTRAKSFRDKVKGLHFRVVVTESRQMYDNVIILGQEHVIIEKEGNDRNYYYSVGLFDNYLDALDLKNVLIRNGFLDIRMKAYLDGKQLNDNDVISLKDLHPELSEFINNELR